MEPFLVDWTEPQVARVVDRARECRLPAAPAGAGWTLGCESGFLERLQQHWVERFDWTAAMTRLNRYPQYIADIDGLSIHFVHVKGEGGRRPLLLTHGWPGSHYEFWQVIEPLAFPSRCGGRAEDAFDLVIPSLPGFGFSGKPPEPIGQRATAALWNRLMTEVLDYPQFLAQGGDWGAVVTSWLGLDHAASVKAIHLNMLGLRSPLPPQNEAERLWMEASQAAQFQYGGYAAVQLSKPQSLAWAAADNPLGQAAWITERFHDWSDLTDRHFEQVHAIDELLTHIMLYVMTDSFTTAAWYYAGLVQDGFCILTPGTRCETPTAYANFPRDALLPPPPRSRVEMLYNLVRWSDFASGGHFAAAERPQDFVADLRSWADECWTL